MARGKSNYTFVVNVPPQTIHNLMNNFLNANGYHAVNENGSVYFTYFDVLWGNRYLEYYIQGNQLTILAYIGSFSKPTLLDDSFVGSAAKQDYKNKLLPLFTEINKLSSGENVYVQPATSQTQQVNQFTDSVNKSKEGMAIAGFVISIIGLLLSCFGITFGLLIIFLEIYFAINGLKTKKKGLAIATLVLGGITFFILIAQIILTILLA